MVPYSRAMFRRRSSALFRAPTLQLRRLLILVVAMALFATSGATAVEAQSTPILTKEDMLSATAFEPHVTLAAVVPGDFFFSTNLHQFVPAMSGDGNWIVYPSLVGSIEIREAEELYRRSMVTGSAQRITVGGAASDPAVSDNGRIVAFDSRESVDTSVPHIRRWKVGEGFIDLSPPQEFARRYDRQPSVSDNGTTVAWMSQEGENPNQVKVWVDGVVRSKPARSEIAGATGLTNATDAMMVSGDGRFVFHVDGAGQPVRWDLVSGDVVQVADVGQVSDDGTLIAGSGPYMGDFLLGSAATVYRVGGGPELVVWHPYFETSVVLPPTFLSGDGSTLLLGDGSLAIEHNFGHSYHLVDVATTTVRRALLPFVAHPIALSDDGRRALMVEEDYNGRYRLWVVDFDTTAAPVVFVDQLSQPQLSHQIRRLFRAILNRTPNDGELLYWTRQRAGGASLPVIADQMVVSAEYTNRFGVPSDVDFLQLLMDHVFWHDDPSEYVERLQAGASRGHIAADISEQTKAIWGHDDPWAFPPVVKDNLSWPSPPKAAQIWRLYQAYFLRNAEQEGLNYWLDLYWTGTSLPVISDYMAASPEFERRYGALADAEFVDRIYLNVLGRPAEAAGKTYWVGQLAAGLTRGEMMIGFSDSPEFIRTTDSIPPGG